MIPGSWKPGCADAWQGEPDDSDSDGVAAVDLGDGVLRIARLPLCGCGEPAASLKVRAGASAIQSR
jgi:hypothetical protein